MAYRTELLGFAINLVLDFIFDSAHHMYIGGGGGGGGPSTPEVFRRCERADRHLVSAGHQEQLTSLLC